MNIWTQTSIVIGTTVSVITLINWICKLCVYIRNRKKQKIILRINNVRNSIFRKELTSLQNYNLLKKSIKELHGIYINWVVINSLISRIPNKIKAHNIDYYMPDFEQEEKYRLINCYWSQTFKFKEYKLPTIDHNLIFTALYFDKNKYPNQKLLKLKVDILNKKSKIIELLLNEFPKEIKIPNKYPDKNPEQIIETEGSTKKLFHDVFLKEIINLKKRKNKNASKRNVLEIWKNSMESNIHLKMGFWNNDNLKFSLKKIIKKYEWILYFGNIIIKNPKKYHIVKRLQKFYIKKFAKKNKIEDKIKWE